MSYFTKPFSYRILAYILRKYDHVSAARYSLGWLPFDLLIQHCALTLMYRLYISDNCVRLDPPLHFGSNHTYDTRLSSHFCNIFRYSTAFGQKFFRSKAVTWWNSLPCSLFDRSFSCHLYQYLLNLQLAIYCIIVCVCCNI